MKHSFFNILYNFLTNNWIPGRIYKISHIKTQKIVFKEAKMSFFPITEYAHFPPFCDCSP